jgi:hypothetical protein
MHREDDRTLRLDPRDSPEEGAERLLRVDIAGPVQGEQAIASGSD